MKNSQETLNVLLNRFTENKVIDDGFGIIALYHTLGRFNELEKFISDNFDFFIENEPADLIEVHIGIYVFENNIEKAEELFKRYNELPYISQAVEEALVNAEELVNNAKKELTKSSYLSLPQIIEKLESTNKIDIQNGISACSDVELKRVLPYLKKIIISEKIDDGTRRLALMALQQKEYGQEVEFRYSKDEIIKVVPKHIVHNIDPDGYKVFEKRLNKIKDVSLVDAIKDNYDMYCIFVYPKQIHDNKDEIFYGCLLAAYSLFGYDTNGIIEEILEQNYNLNNVLSVKNKISESFETFR